MVPVYWDNGTSFRLFDRETCSLVYPDIVDAMMAEVEAE